MKEDFLKYQAQTSTHPFMVEISRASGSYIYDTEGKQYLDFIAGVSANPLGHNHPEVVKGVKEQIDQYMHVMVYGEFVQAPQVKLAKLLASKLPSNLDCSYFTNSGTEAIEGAMKLAKRYTGRAEIIAAFNAYHGNTQGAMSVCGNEEHIRAFRPLIPNIRHLQFNTEDHLKRITSKTAAVLLETVQGGAGFILPANDYLKKVKARCKEVGALLILDEIQSGIGRTGAFFGFENYDVVPDILVTGKGLGGGMPIGAFISSQKIMGCLKENPKLGHITTFGGHPVIAAAALATVNTIYNTQVMSSIVEKEKLFRKLLTHPLIVEIRGKGLMLALLLESSQMATALILKCKEQGLLLYWLLYEPKAVRITPPLTLTEDEIYHGCNIIINALNDLMSNYSI